MMSFLSTVVTSRFPSTNNQLRNSSNLCQQATIHDARVTVQPLQGRPNSYAADPGIAKGPVIHTIIINNAVYQADDLDAYDSVCDDITTAKVALMANLSCYGSDVLSEVPHSDNTHNDMLNQSVQEMPLTPSRDKTKRLEKANERYKSAFSTFSKNERQHLIQTKELQNENELLKSKGVDCTKCQSFQVQVKELKSVNDSLTKTNQKLLNSRERGKANLQQRDEKISAIRIVIVRRTI
uniref:Uncharacterized protein n=1 Tax=Tanacetum cinerariifolium TaxID=118510 RepID=A0A6L2K2R0_TANCI|nr:hypothetical protein [Tanacetum cinerariifolium]